jgi:hypothetical protein
MHPLQTYSTALMTHQANIPIHIQTSLCLTPVSSMHFFWAQIFAKYVVSSVSLYWLLHMVVIYCHLQLYTAFFVACCFHCHLFFPVEIYSIIMRHVEKTEILSALLIWLKELLFLRDCPVTKRKNSASLISNSEEILWLIFVLCRDDEAFFFYKRFSPSITSLERYITVSNTFFCFWH